MVRPNVTRKPLDQTKQYRLEKLDGWLLSALPPRRRRPGRGYQSWVPRCAPLHSQSANAIGKRRVDHGWFLRKYRLRHWFPRSYHVSTPQISEFPESKEVRARNRPCETPSDEIGVLYVPEQTCQGKLRRFGHTLLVAKVLQCDEGHPICERKGSFFSGQ